jgi:hypothetical protein
MFTKFQELLDLPQKVTAHQKCIALLLSSLVNEPCLLCSPGSPFRS